MNPTANVAAVGISQDSSIAVSAGLIGAGRMGKSHLRAAQLLGCKLTAICDVNPDNLQKVGDEFGVEPARRFISVDSFFDARPLPELVVIATTADWHAALTIRAAEAGARMILCEKPMATSLAECQAMIDACRQNGARLAINHQMRFMDQYTLVKRHLASGRFGPLASMNVVAGCFGLAMNGSHYFEAFRYLADSPIVEVTSRLDPAPLPSPRGQHFFDRSGQVHAVAANGMRLHMEISADQGHGMTVTYATRYGHLFVDELAGICVATCRDTQHHQQPVTRYGMPWQRWEESFPQADNVGSTRSVLQALLKGDDYPSGDDGRQVIASLVAAYRSSEQSGGSVQPGSLSDALSLRFPWA